jgi:uncharacterized OsmC-like protein
MDASKIATAIREAKGYLSEHPEEARYRDSEAVAVVENSLIVRVEGDGWTLRTDMSRGVGGGASAASPGWMMRAALASCVATLITMRAAERGIALHGLRVAVDSESDDRGILGIAENVPAGPLSMRLRVSADPGDQDESLLREVIEWGFDHCPVCDAIQRSVPVQHVVELRGPVT